MPLHRCRRPAARTACRCDPGRSGCLGQAERRAAQRARDPAERQPARARHQRAVPLTTRLCGTIVRRSRPRSARGSGRRAPGSRSPARPLPLVLPVESRVGVRHARAVAVAKRFSSPHEQRVVVGLADVHRNRHAGRERHEARIRRLQLRRRRRSSRCPGARSATRRRPALRAASGSAHAT